MSDGGYTVVGVVHVVFMIIEVSNEEGLGVEINVTENLKVEPGGSSESTSLFQYYLGTKEAMANTIK